ncbi:hypothetical protein T265_08397 [Opisthorchis viverrini]|uniref:Uncharacterized protein n=1 Tax=Opisthorchis viverrini TaxID=6198 RepID=A0A074ZKC3_OPIVI|nr:hypothetical protein T265_08397 [Opisthorchis viverrini]KER23810.1 hypothetical protein T265_08397 [Opisthorchis viverrini]
MSSVFRQRTIFDLQRRRRKKYPFYCLEDPDLQRVLHRDAFCGKKVGVCFVHSIFFHTYTFCPEPFEHYSEETGSDPCDSVLCYNVDRCHRNLEIPELEILIEGISLAALRQAGNVMSHKSTCSISRATPLDSSSHASTSLPAGSQQ